MLLQEIYFLNLKLLQLCLFKYIKYRLYIGGRMPQRGSYFHVDTVESL